MKKEHRNKMIAPIIIAAVLIVYYVAIAAVFMLIPDLTVIMKLLMVIIPLALAGVAFADATASYEYATVENGAGGGKYRPRSRA